MDGETDDVEPLFEHWKFVVETIRDSVHSPVVIMIGWKPEPDSAELYEVYQQNDSLIKTYATQNPASVIFIDIWEQLHAVENSESLYRDDGLHLSDEGYEILTSLVKAVIE
jgi:lysophospholipase L1-like esterase